MKRDEFAQIQRQVCVKVDYLYNALRTIPDINAEALQRAKKLITASPYVDKQEKIQYSVDDIIVSISPNDIKRLSKIPCSEIYLAELHIRMNGVIDAQLWNYDDMNPWETLTFGVELKILSMKGSLLSKKFHVDQIKGGEISFKEVHPLSHLHFNDTIGDGEGKISINVPRLVHYPLDVVLGLSMTLQNFTPEKFKKLRTKGEYISLCYESQKRILLPYFSSFSNCIDSEGKSNDEVRKLCPYLL